MTEAEKQAIETMKHWIEYEKANKDKINKADELIKMQETILNLIDKKDKIIDEMVYYLSDFDIDEMCEQCECCIGNGCHADDDVEFKMRCIKEYFKKKVEEK